MLAFAQQTAERYGLSRRKARLAHQILRHKLRRRYAVRAGLAMVLAAGLDRAQEAVLRQHNPVRHHFTLRDRRAKPPGGGNQHLSLGRLAQAAT